MKQHKDNMAFADSIKQKLDDSLDDIDGITLSRLQAARRRAVAAYRPGRALLDTKWFIPAGGFATAAMAVLAIFLVLKEPGENLPAGSVDDFELLTSSVNLDMLDDFEFYDWLPIEEGSAT